MQKAFFLDKDGTLVDNSEYPEIIPTDAVMDDEVVEGLRLIQEKGFKMIIVSNQPWIAKMRMTKEQVEDSFKSVIRQLNAKGVVIDDYFYCPHSSADNCSCKKPKPGLLKLAAEKHDIDFSQSFMVGDMDLDIECGEVCGAKTVLVLTGLGVKYDKLTKPDYVLKNINEVSKIL